MKPPIEIVHVSAWIRTIGGVETLLTRHAEADAASGFDSHQLALFDRGTGFSRRQYTALKFSWRSTPRVMRSRISAWFQTHPDQLVLWHNGWGVHWFADVDRSQRRIVCLWDGVAQFGPWLAAAAPFIDGVTCMSASAANDVARLLPQLPRERIGVLPVPITLPPTSNVRRPVGRKLVIGCAGRLVRSPKRWDRLVPFVAELRRLCVDFRIEVVSDGPMRRWLQRQFGGDPAIQFLGWQDTADYGRRLQTWDAAVFFSDHEGGPIAMLEAMAAGVIPFYPTIGGSIGDDYAPQIDPRCHYPAGDPVAASQAMREVFASQPAEILAMRDRARSLAQSHIAATYHEAFENFTARISGLPRLSCAAQPRRSRWTDYLPLGVITRFLPEALWR